MLTEKCNLRCAYCLRGTNDKGKEMPFPVLKRIILSAYRFGIRAFSVTGGEFFIYPHWRQLIELVGSLKSWILIETNGYDLKEEEVIFIKHTLNNRIFKVLVSLDSYRQEVHDKFRGEGSFAKAVQAIKLLRQHDIAVGANILITPLNFLSEEDLADYLEFNKKLGVSEVYLGETVGLGRAKESPFMLSDNQRRRINKILVKRNYFRGSGMNLLFNTFIATSEPQACSRLGWEMSISPYGIHPCIFQVETVKLGDFNDFEKLLYSDFLSSLYWVGMAMQKCYKKEAYFNCAKCVKYLPAWLVDTHQNIHLNPK